MEKKKAKVGNGKLKPETAEFASFLIANGYTVKFIKAKIDENREWLERIEPIILKATGDESRKRVLNVLTRLRGSVRRNLRVSEKLLKMLEG